MRKIQIAACVLCLVLLLDCAGCSILTRESDQAEKSGSESSLESAAQDSASQDSASQDSTSQEASAKEQQTKQILRMTILRPESLDPLEVTDADEARFLWLMYLPIVDTDEEGMPTDRGAACSWQLSEEGKILTLQLSSHPVFSDGSIATAEDVIYSLQAFSESETPNYWKTQLENLSSYRVVTIKEGENKKESMELTLKRPIDTNNMGFLNIPLLKAPAAEEKAEEEAEEETVYSGPYYLKHYQSMKEIILEANPYYLTGEPHIHQICAEIVRTLQAGSTAFRHQLTDIYYEEDPTSLSIDNTAGHTVSFVNTDQMRFLYINQQSKAFFADSESRSALSYAIDNAQLTSRTTMRLGVEATTMIPEWICSGLDESLVVNLKAAQAIFKEKSVTDIRLIYEEEDAEGEMQGEILSQMLQDAGLTIRLAALSEAEYTQALETGNYDLALGTAHVTSLEAFRSLLSSVYLNRSDDEETSGLDAAFQQVYAAETVKEQQNKLKELEEVLREEMPILPLYYPRQAVIVSRNLQGELESTVYRIYRGIESLSFIE